MNTVAPDTRKDRFWGLLRIVLLVNVVIPMLVPLWFTTGSVEGDGLLVCLPPLLGAAHCLSKAVTFREKVLGMVALVVGLIWFGMLAVGWFA